MPWTFFMNQRRAEQLAFQKSVFEVSLVSSIQAHLLLWSQIRLFTIWSILLNFLDSRTYLSSDFFNLSVNYLFYFSTYCLFSDNWQRATICSLSFYFYSEMLLISSCSASIFPYSSIFFLFEEASCDFESRSIILILVFSSQSLLISFLKKNASFSAFFLSSFCFLLSALQSFKIS